MARLSAPRIGYVPHGPDLQRPMDRRRFPRYAAMRGLQFEIVSDWDGYDIIVLSPSADVTRWANAPASKSVVVDLPDAFLAERRGFRRSFRGLAKWVVGELGRPVFDYYGAVERLLERADAIVCSTEEQALEIGRYNYNVHPIMDLNGEIGCQTPEVCPTDGLDILWQGLTATLPSIQQVVPALRSLAREHEVRLHLVTDLSAPRYMNRFLSRPTRDLVSDWGIDVRLYEWSIDRLIEIASCCDIGIVPVDLTDPMAVGKAENRMLIFWRLGLPVVASATPANLRASSLAGLEDRVLCSTVDDWRLTLERLYLGLEERLEIASAGQAVALSSYSEETLAQHWDRVFESL
jgi:hypothetical protein